MGYSVNVSLVEVGISPGDSKSPQSSSINTTPAQLKKTQATQPSSNEAVEGQTCPSRPHKPLPPSPPPPVGRAVLLGLLPARALPWVLADPCLCQRVAGPCLVGAAYLHPGRASQGLQTCPYHRARLDLKQGRTKPQAHTQDPTTSNTTEDMIQQQEGSKARRTVAAVGRKPQGGRKAAGQAQGQEGAGEAVLGAGVDQCTAADAG